MTDLATATLEGGDFRTTLAVSAFFPDCFAGTVFFVAVFFVAGVFRFALPPETLALDAWALTPGFVFVFVFDFDAFALAFAFDTLATGFKALAFTLAFVLTFALTFVLTVVLAFVLTFALTFAFDTLAPDFNALAFTLVFTLDLDEGFPAFFLLAFDFFPAVFAMSFPSWIPVFFTPPCHDSGYRLWTSRSVRFTPQRTHATNDNIRPSASRWHKGIHL